METKKRTVEVLLFGFLGRAVGLLANQLSYSYFFFISVYNLPKTAKNTYCKTKSEVIMQQTKTREAEMLEKIYKNMKMGSDSMVNLMPAAKDEEFKTLMTAQLDGYEKFAAQARDRLLTVGGEPKEENVMTKMWASVGMKMNTMMDSTTSHLAEMIVEGSTMGMTDTIKVLRDYENTDVSETAMKLAKDIIKFEEKNIEIMKKHL